MKNNLSRFGVLIVAAALVAPLSSVRSQTKETLAARGLQQPVEIIVDQWGIPHIYAKNEHDLFFAQGFNAARDRLFQLELWRRQATGTMSEIVGRRALKNDLGARLFKYRGDLEQDLNSYNRNGTTIFKAFVDGINAYIDLTVENPKLLPVEFRLLGITPGKWTLDVTISRHLLLVGNATSEIRTAKLVAALGAERVKELSVFQPENPDLSLNGVDASQLSDDILALYTASRTQVTFLPQDIAADSRSASAVRQIRAATPGSSVAGEAPDPRDLGSNNWIVSGTRTMSKRPILANDPHRAISVPSLRYVVHLSAPGWNMIGSGEPTVPGVAMGHNDFGAWGLTIHGQDMEDLCVYDINPANPLQYRYQGRWETMSVVKDSIFTKGEGATPVELKFTRHGPVLYEDAANHKAYALRAAWLNPGAAPYLANLRYGQARSWSEFRDAVSYHIAPGHNVIWADMNGDIGWQVAGLAPVRKNFSGLVPVPGDGRFEWDGFIPIKFLPHVLNPKEGYFASANEYNLPADYPVPYSYSFSEPFRSSRIHEVLGSSNQFITINDMMALQTDELSVPARQLVPLLRSLQISDQAAKRAADMLLGWNFVLDKNSVPAAIYIAWERRLRMNANAAVLPAETRSLLGNLPTVRMIELLSAPDGRFGANPTSARDELLIQSLQQGLSDLRTRLGPDMGRWQYGQANYHHLTIRHLLSDAVRPELRKKLDLGPLPRGGNAQTVNPTGAGDNQTSGPSYRIIADVGDWDNTVGITGPGQSGDPDSPHYSDLFERWVNGQFIPFLFSRDRVESAAGTVITVNPR